MTAIKELLDEFKAKYKWKISVEKKVIDFTECFRNSGGAILFPRNYGDPTINVVLGYVIFGAPLLEKYELEDDGRFKRNEGRLVIKPFSDDARVMSCLCLRDLANTSLHEIAGARDRTEEIATERYRPQQVQGFEPWQTSNIIDMIERRYSEFQLSRDSAFLFAGSGEQSYNRLKLNQMWLGDILFYGSDMLGQMSLDEAVLMGKVFSQDILAGDKEAIKHGSYMYDRMIHTPESVEFLSRKVYQFY